MRLVIEGEKITKDDLLKIGKFFARFFKDRKDLCKIFITQGTENMTSKEGAKLLSKMFENRKHHIKIFGLTTRYMD